MSCLTSSAGVLSASIISNFQLFVLITIKFPFFPPSKYPYREEKNKSSNNTHNHKQNLHQLGCGAFFSVSARILWLYFHSSSASLIFTFPLKRFVPRFLQRVVLGYQSPLSDIHICSKPQDGDLSHPTPRDWASFSLP